MYKQFIFLLQKLLFQLVMTPYTVSYRGASHNAQNTFIIVLEVNELCSMKRAEYTYLQFQSIQHLAWLTLVPSPSDAVDECLDCWRGKIIRSLYIQMQSDNGSIARLPFWVTQRRSPNHKMHKRNSILNSANSLRKSKHHKNTYIHLGDVNPREIKHHNSTW